MREGSERNSGEPCGRRKRGQNCKWTSSLPLLPALVQCIPRSLLSTHISALRSAHMLKTHSSTQPATRHPSRMSLILLAPRAKYVHLPFHMLTATQSRIDQSINTRLILPLRETSFVTLPGH